MPSGLMRFLVLVVVCVTVAGCGGNGSRLTQANYDQITEGMSLGRVEVLLGKGEVMKDAPALEGVAKVREKHKNSKTLKWEWKPKSVIIIFVDEKVVFKSKGGF